MFMTIWTGSNREKINTGWDLMKHVLICIPKFLIQEQDGFGIEFSYDNHYCKYFEKKPSVWTLEFSDGYKAKLGK